MKNKTTKNRYINIAMLSVGILVFSFVAYFLMTEALAADMKTLTITQNGKVLSQYQVDLTPQSTTIGSSEVIDPPIEMSVDRAKGDVTIAIEGVPFTDGNTFVVTSTQSGETLNPIAVYNGTNYYMSVTITFIDVPTLNINGKSYELTENSDHIFEPTSAINVYSSTSVSITYNAADAVGVNLTCMSDMASSVNITDNTVSPPNYNYNLEFLQEGQYVFDFPNMMFNINYSRAVQPTIEYQVSMAGKTVNATFVQGSAGSADSSSGSGAPHYSAYISNSEKSVILSIKAIPLSSTDVAMAAIGGKRNIGNLEYNTNNVSVTPLSNESWQISFLSEGSHTIYYYSSSSDYPLQINVDYTKEEVSRPSHSRDEEEKKEEPIIIEPPKINLINIQNKENVSSDTILTSNNVNVKDDVAEVEPTKEEIDALISLLELHKDDIPLGEREAIFNVQKVDGADEYALSISPENFDEILNSSADIIGFKTPIGDFRIRSSEAKGLKIKQKIRIFLKPMKNNGYPGLDVTLSENDAEIKKFDTPYSIEVRIPYTPKANEDINALIIEYIHLDGEKEIIKECEYDAKNKELCFFVSHLSKFGINYNPVLFNDVPRTHPESGNIMFLAARGIIKPDEKGNYSPDESITRGEYLNIITNAFSETKSNELNIKIYSDVDENNIYCTPIAWAKLNNIIYFDKESSGDYFYPANNLSREDCVTIANNVAIALGLRFKDTGEVLQFSDSGMISSYAVLSIERMIKAGVIESPKSSRFFPKEFQTKAETAKVVSRLLSLLR